MIKKVIHIADTHIPNLKDGSHYDELIKYLCQEVLTVIGDTPKDEVRIVVSGDVFDKKIRSDNESKALFHTFMNYLNAIAKTIIIAGNHDLLENNTDRLDSITPTFLISGAYPNIAYADKALSYKSGYIVDDNVIWALYSICDKYADPNISGLKKKYPDHRIIGLYHGDVIGATTDTGRMCEDGIDLKLFNGCDCVMAGHIHKYQCVRKNGIPIVYAGSSFQQNFGENTTGHGFVEWDLETMEYKHHEVKNPYKMYKFEISSYDDVKNDVEQLMNL